MLYLAISLIALSGLGGGGEPAILNYAPEEIDPKQIWNLSREGFIQELVYARATPRTPQFDDYTPGSYHVEKIDLLDGVRTRRAATTPQIKGLLVVGPVGPLWAYYVTLFTEEKEGVRATDVNFPHARITFKRTKLLSGKEYKKFLDSLTRSRSLIEGMPSFDTIRRSRNVDLPLEWHYEVLLGDWSSGKERVFHSVIAESELGALLKAWDALFEKAVVTYASDISEEESVYNPVDEAPPN
jgi:hypothetical protein